MRTNETLQTDHSIYLEPLLPEHVNNTYVRWLNDKQVTRFTEISPGNHTIETTRQYVNQMIKADNAMIWRILTAERQHIGNISLVQIHTTHRRTQIGIIIGDRQTLRQAIALSGRQSQSRGFGSRAFKLISIYAFETLKLYKLCGVVNELNTPCIKALENAGFHKEAIRRKHAWHKDRFVDVVEMARFAPLACSQ